MNISENNAMHYHSEEPYPEIQVEQANKQYAALLLEDYAGMVSELSASTFYIFNHISISKDNPESSEIFEKIAIVEMHHLDILGKLILSLGVTPKYYTFHHRGIRFWQSTFIAYPEQYIQMLKQSIESENKAIKQYTYHIHVIQDHFIQSILKRIIKDEEVHIKIFEKLLNEAE